MIRGNKVWEGVSPPSAAGLSSAPWWCIDTTLSLTHTHGSHIRGAKRADFQRRNRGDTDDLLAACCDTVFGKEHTGLPGAVRKSEKPSRCYC